MELKTGWNIVVYTGAEQLSVDAFSSILPYLDPEKYIARYDAPTQAYKSVKSSSEAIQVDEDTMIQNACYQICVTQLCEWTYGAEEVPPTGVQLYTGNNFVAYCGPLMTAGDALALIVNYLSTIYTWNAETQGWDTIGIDTILQPGRCYILGVTQDCTWVYPVPAPPSMWETVTPVIVLMMIMPLMAGVFRG